MKIGFLITALALIYIGVCIAFAVARRTAKTRIRFYTVFGSSVISLIILLIGKNTFLPNIAHKLIPTFAKLIMGKNAASALDLTGDASGIVLILEKYLCAILAPLLFFILFTIISFTTWVIFAIVTKILSKSLENTKNSIGTSIAYGLFQSLVVIGVLLVPISFYSQISPMIVDSAVSANMMDRNSARFMIYVEEVDDSLDLYRACGGSLVTNALSDVSLKNGKKVHFKDEIGALSGIAMDGYALSLKFGKEGTEAEQAEIMRRISDNLTRSQLLTAITGELVYSATDKWLEGDKFLGIGAPSAGELIDPMLNKTLTILHDDALDPKLLGEDVDTTFKVVALMMESGLISGFTNSEKLAESLSNSKLTHDVIVTLGENIRMRGLINDFTDLGLHAIASAIKVPESTEALYDEFISGISSAIDKTKTLSQEERSSALSSELTTLFSDVGITADKNILSALSVALIMDTDKLLPSDDINQAVREFFAVYAQVSEKSKNEPELISISTDTNTGSAPLTSSIYIMEEGESLRTHTFAGAFAFIVNEAQKISENDANRDSRLEAVVREALTKLTSELSDQDRETVVEIIKTGVLNASKVTATDEALVSLRSPKTVQMSLATFEEIMNAKTGNDLTADSVEALATAVGSLLSYGSEMVALIQQSNGSGNFDTSSIAGAVGGMLNTLKDMPTVGEEATELLFISVVQSDSVISMIQMTPSDARTLAHEMVGIGDYKLAFKAVTVGLQVKETVSQNKLTQQTEVENIIDVVTPETVDMFKNQFTPTQLKEYGIQTDKAESTSAVISILMDNISTHDEEVREQDVSSVMNILNIAILASEKNYVEGNMLGDNGKLGDTQGFVNDILDSQLGYETLVDGMTENGAVKEEFHDAFGIGSKLTESDKAELLQSVENYVSRNPEKALEADALLALFGVQNNG